MVWFSLSDWLLVAGVATVAVMPSQVATGAVGDGEMQRLAEAAAFAPRMLEGAANVELRFIQEDGPESGHVRVVLTPEARPLTMLEARSAAQQAFLAALSEPGLGDDLSRITVVVRLMPASRPDPAQAEQVFRFLHKGGRDWSILAGE
jgi:hypothetical protein